MKQEVTGIFFLLVRERDIENEGNLLFDCISSLEAEFFMNFLEGRGFPSTVPVDIPGDKGTVSFLP